MNTLISVVTLTHNKAAYTKKCLRSLLQSSYAPWELIVVDNGSTDDTLGWLQNFKIEAKASGVCLKIIENAENVGCSTGRNQGLSVAEGTFVVFMDNDVALRTKDWIEGLLSCLKENRRNAMAGPKLIYPFSPYAIQCAGVGISPSGRVQFMGRGEARTDSRFNKQKEVQCLISACFMTRRSAIESVGGFDEAFNPVEYEDFDLCYRIRQNGGVVTYVPSVEMYHFESVTTTGTPTLPNTYLIIKHGMLFKKRWRYMFENENGPSDSETTWKFFEAHSLNEASTLPITENKKHNNNSIKEIPND
ncbi:MAG: glycosyltransferase family 2 protein [Lentisphaerae bacterium]|nr:glycosyltransferase family 2 protein [Lentisphaerota bacterium]